MLDRSLLRYFLAVVDQGSFTRAAAACRVTQPTLSAGIAKLEGLLGEPVLMRTSRRVELTAAGSRLVGHARRIEAEFARAEGGLSDANVRLMRVGIVSTLPARLIRAAVARALAAAPGERLELVEGRDRELAAALDRGRVDAVVAPDMGGAALFEEGYGVAMAAGHALAGEAQVAAERIAAEPMIVRRHCEALSEVSRHFTSRGVRPFMAARTTSDDRAAAFVAAGLGVTVMPACFAGDGVAVVPLEGFARRRVVGLATVADSARRVADSQVVEALVGALRRASPRA
ncbi:LysR family transcriptional regulator [Sphingomonas adhaesiva]|uniref:LysR family transcriptional regulator n=1 Tax=Sphingomonas adhaesiva TaxID=28212 RepID=UPI002FF7309A